MRKGRIKKTVSAIIAVFVVLYSIIALRVAFIDRIAPPAQGPLTDIETLVIFGASGTAGDGILKAVLTSTDIDDIRVFTRRLTPRMEAGIAAGRVDATIHMDYLDYSAIRNAIVNADAVFWAIGLSSLGVDEDTYRRIHVDFPVAFVKEWLAVSERDAISFHYLSSSDISEDSSAMWARVKVEAENALFALAGDSKLDVIAYRPDYIGPTTEEAHLGQQFLYGFFRPLGAAVRAIEIGNSMLEVAARADDYNNGDKVGTFGIVRLSNAFDERLESN